MFRRVLTAAVVLSFGMSGLASAADKATGWHNWADHAEKVVAAAKSGDRNALNAACIGTTKTIAMQGFQFPRWAQLLPGFCGSYQAETINRTITVADWKRECRSLRDTANDIGKSQAVPEEPRAKPLADDMVAILNALDVRECSKRPERAR